MKIQNVTTYLVTISDLRHHTGSIGCVIQPGQILEVFDADAEKSVGLAELITAGSIVTITEDPRGSMDVLDDRLSVSLNANGTLKTALRVDIKEAGTLKVTDPDVLNFVNATVSESPSGTALITINGASTGTTSNTYTVDSDSTTGKMILDVALGSTDNTLTITNNALTGNRVVTFQDATGLVALDGTVVHTTGTESIAGNKTFSDRIICSTAAATYTAPCLGVGIYGTPLAEAGTALTDNIFATVNVSTGVNKTVADSSCMALFVGNRTTAAVTNNKMQGVLSSMIIAHNVFDAYAGQFHISIDNTMSTQAGNANLVGLACKANIATSKTATGNVSALYCVLDSGTGTAVTGTYDAIRIENNATGCNSAINFGATANMAYLLSMATGGCVAASTTTTISGDGYSVKVKINGEDCYIRCAKTA